MRFEKAVEELLRIEGGVSDHRADAGGLTKYGITLGFFRAVRPGSSREDLLRLTREEASEMYRREFWDRYRCAEMPPEIGEAVFSTVVNLPPKEAVRVLQRAVRRAGAAVVVDGRLGPATLGALGRVDQTELKRRFTAELCLYYEDRVRKRPANRVFLAGWFYRAAGLFG